MPSPDASAPTRFCVQGERPCWWEQAQGLNSRIGERSRRGGTPRKAVLRNASLCLRKFPTRSRGYNAACLVHFCRGACAVILLRSIQ